MLKWILITIGVLCFAVPTFNTYCAVVTKAASQESTISYASKNSLAYDLQGLQAKLYSNKTLMHEFSALEVKNVDENMNAKRTIAIGLMSMLGGDIRNLGAPTNGLMKLDTTAVLYQEIITTSNKEYGNVVNQLKNRANMIRDYETFCADPSNRVFLAFSRYPSMKLEEEKKWGIDNLSHDWLK